MVTTAPRPSAVGNPQRLLTPAPLLDPAGISALRPLSPAIEHDNEHGFCLLNLMYLAVLERQMFPHVPSQLEKAKGNALCNETVIHEISRFLERIEQDWFPVLTDEAWEVCIEPDIAWSLSTLPLMLCGLDYEHPDEVYDDGVFGNSGIVDLLMCLASAEMWEFSDEEFQERIDEQMHATYEEIPYLPAKFELSDVVVLLEAYPPPAPLDDLATVCRLVLRATNNVWLDISHREHIENYSNQGWDDLDNLLWLRERWQAAEAVLEARQRFEAWADAPLANNERRYRGIVQLLINRWEIRNGQMVLPLEF